MVQPIAQTIKRKNSSKIKFDSSSMWYMRTNGMNGVSIWKQNHAPLPARVRVYFHSHGNWLNLARFLLFYIEKKNWKLNIFEWIKEKWVALLLSNWMSECFMYIATWMNVQYLPYLHNNFHWFTSYFKASSAVTAVVNECLVCWFWSNEKTPTPFIKCITNQTPVAFLNAKVNSFLFLAQTEAAKVDCRSQIFQASYQIYLFDAIQMNLIKYTEQLQLTQSHILYLCWC